METRLVRLKKPDPKRGHVLRRYTYKGIRILAERGWYRVALDIAEELKAKRQIPNDEHAPLAFDVCSDEEAQQLDERESREERPTLATEAIRVMEPRNEAKGEDGKPKSGAKRQKATE